jgi:hypothetical protein
MDIHINPNQNIVTIEHVLTNLGKTKIQLAPWGITQLKLGGIAIFPQKITPIDGNHLLPNRNLVLWPYSSWADNRVSFFDDFYYLNGRADNNAFKFGYKNFSG